MKTATGLTALLLSLALAAGPALADKGHGGGHGNGKGPKGHGGGHASFQCPPGLAKKDPACIPPGQAKKYAKRQDEHRGHRHVIGDRLGLGDYILVRDPSRYGYEARDGWRYYRDGSDLYRVDSSTRRVLAVLQLIDAFTH